MNNLNKKLSKNIPLDYLYTFLANLNMSDSIWVLYLAYCGMSLMEIGILEGIFHITGMVCEIPSGALADLAGRRASMIAGRICAALSCIIMLLSGSFGWFALGFVLQALGHNLNSGSEEALIYDSMKCLGREADYMRVNGRLNMLIEVSQAIATVVGGALAEYSYVWCYSACVIIAILGIIPAVLMMEPVIMESVTTEPITIKPVPTEPIITESVIGEAPAGTADSKRTAKSSITTVILDHFRSSIHVLANDQRVRNIVLFYSAVFAAYTLLFFYSQQYFSDLGFNKIQISLIMLFAGGVSCLGALCSARLYQALGVRLAKLAAAAIALSIAVFGLNSLMVSIGAILTASFFNAALYPIQSNALNALIPSAQRATLISVDSMVFSIFMILIFPVSGALGDAIGLSTVFAGTGVILFSATALCWSIRLN